MKKYDSYKDSGIEWIGEIPSHWEIKKLNWCFELIGSGTTPKADNLLYYLDGNTNWLLTGDLNDGEIFDTSKKITQKAIDDHSTLKVYPTESIVMAMYGATIGKLGVLKIETTVNQACCVLSKPLHLNYKFAFYILLSARTEIINMSYGGGQPNISQELIKSFRVQIPPIEEQTSIASLLDLKTTEIDEIIAAKKRLLELYEEEKTAIINQAVTKGLDPNAPMKDSGIEWLGEIPEHWEVKKVKYVMKSLNSIRVPLSSEERGKMIKREYDYYGASGIIDKVESYLFDEPLLLIGEDGANLITRSSKLSFIARGKYWVNNHAHILRPTFGVLEYYCEIMEICDYSIWISGSAQPKLTSDNLMNIEIVVPPIQEQQSIVNHIESEYSKIDFKKARTEELIELLTEYRTALISEVVTGKIKVIEDCKNNKGASQYHQDH